MSKSPNAWVLPDHEEMSALMHVMAERRELRLQYLNAGALGRTEAFIKLGELNTRLDTAWDALVKKGWPG